MYSKESSKYYSHINWRPNGDLSWRESFWKHRNWTSFIRNQPGSRLPCQSHLCPDKSALMSGRHPFEIGISHTIRRERMAPGGNVAGITNCWLQNWLIWKSIWGWKNIFRKPWISRSFDAWSRRIKEWLWFEENSENTYFDSVLLNKKVVKSKAFVRCFLTMLNTSKWFESESPFFAYIFWMHLMVQWSLQIHGKDDSSKRMTIRQRDAMVWSKI